MKNGEIVYHLKDIYHSFYSDLTDPERDAFAAAIEILERPADSKEDKKG